MSYIDDPIQVLITCALEKEFEALKYAFRKEWSTHYEKTLGERDYVFLTVNSSTNLQKSAKIAITCFCEMGRVPSAIATRDVMYSFHTAPKYLILTGIAASQPETRYKLGDVLVAKKIVDFGEQKHSDNGEVRFRGLDFDCSKKINKIAESIAKTTWHEEIDAGIKNAAEPLLNSGVVRWPPQCHTDVVIACGDFVVNSRGLAQKILEELTRSRKSPVNVIEMESGGVAAAINTAWPYSKPELTVIKGISDYAYNKTDSAQPLAAAVAATFTKLVILKLIDDNYLQSDRVKPVISQKKLAILRPTHALADIVNELPEEIAISWRRTMIDGAVEVLSCPRINNPYGGFKREVISCKPTSIEWPHDVDMPDKWSRLGNLALGLTGDKNKGIDGWLKRTGQKSSPGRIRFLSEVPAQPVLDRSELHLSFGNSDYFTMRTIHEASKAAREGRLGGIAFSDIFSSRWGTKEKPFPPDCIPYHVSAQGVLICTDPITHYEYLILANLNPQSKSLVSGWGATMAEQMWAPEPRIGFEPWWSSYIQKKRIAFKDRDVRIGDEHIFDTLRRGLSEEFGLEDDDYASEPLLLNLSLEQDMYFLAFIFFVRVSMEPMELYTKWRNAPDHKEMNALAAYQIVGYDKYRNKVDGPRSLANLLSQEQFNATDWLLPEPRDYPLTDWHPSSRMRIYLAGMHMWYMDFGRYITLSDKPK